MHELHTCIRSTPFSTVFISCVCVLSHSAASSSLQPHVAHKAPLPVRFSRQDDWSGLPFPLPGDLPDLGIEPTSLVSPALAGGFFNTVPPGSSQLPFQLLSALKVVIFKTFSFPSPLPLFSEKLLADE